MSLEKTVAGGGFYYIHSISHNAAENSLTVEFVRAPEEMSSAKRFLTFTDIEAYSMEADEDFGTEEAAGEVIDSLIGLDECPEDGKVMYVLRTENREFVFRTSRKPEVRDVQSGAAI